MLSRLSWGYLHFSYKLQGQEGTRFIIQPCSRHSLCHTRFELQLCFCWWGRCSFVPQPWRWWEVRRKVCIYDRLVIFQFWLYGETSQIYLNPDLSEFSQMHWMVAKGKDGSHAVCPRRNNTIWDKYSATFGHVKPAAWLEGLNLLISRWCSYWEMVL